MASFHKLLLLLSLLCISTTAESAELWNQFCNDNSPINSTQLSKNIDTLLGELVSGIIIMQTGFTTTSYGEAGQNEVVFGLAQCRGDVSNKDCSICIQDASKQIRKLCPSQADARIWYDHCFLRYDTKNFFGQADTSTGIISWNTENVTEPDSFNKHLEKLSDKVSSKAVAPGSKGLGKGKKELSKLPSVTTLYELVQCTRDLSKLSCAQCLATAIRNNFPTLCSNKRGCTVLYPSCIVRYELYPFF